jgi:predicted enzyme related to lactoylglutathione lyase
MSERTSYTPGTPCWVDLATPDIDAAEQFYGALFGWEVPELPNSAEMGGYRRAKKNGKDVAGVYPLMEAGQHPAWATYVAVEDAAATGALIGENGGTTIVAPMDIGMGHMAVFADPAGAVFGLWQPVTFVGAELVNEAGCFGWNELGTRDTAGAKQFYSAVFGWGTQEEGSERAGTYTVWTVGEAMVGGMIDMNALGMPAEVPPNWLVYFTVDDADAAVDAVNAGGGDIRMGPIEIPVGRFAVVADPAGAVFAVMQPSEETLANMP